MIPHFFDFQSFINRRPRHSGRTPARAKTPHLFFSGAKMLIYFVGALR